MNDLSFPVTIMARYKQVNIDERKKRQPEARRFQYEYALLNLGQYDLLIGILDKFIFLKIPDFGDINSTIFVDYLRSREVF